jgi:hypothetical protein
MVTDRNSTALMRSSAVLEEIAGQMEAETVVGGMNYIAAAI